MNRTPAMYRAPIVRFRPEADIAQTKEGWRLKGVGTLKESSIHSTLRTTQARLFGKGETGMLSCQGANRPTA